MSIPLDTHIPLEPDNIKRTVEWVKSLFPGGAHTFTMRKNLILNGKLIELQGEANPNPDDFLYGTVNFQLYPEVQLKRRKGERSLTLYFHVEEESLDAVNLRYIYGDTPLYIDFHEKPPGTFEEYLERAKANDPDKLPLFKILAKSPLFKTIEELYEGTVKHLLAHVEHWQIHTDTSDFEESHIETVTPEEFDRLEVGDHLFYLNRSGEEPVKNPCTVVAIDKINKTQIVVQFPSGKSAWIRRDPEDLKRIKLDTPIEHWQVHTDVDFEESKKLSLREADIHGYDLFLEIPLSDRNLADTTAWAKSLFPGAAPSFRWHRKVIPNPQGEIELQGNATDDPNDGNFGSVNFRAELSRDRLMTYDAQGFRNREKRRAPTRIAELQFYVERGQLNYVNLGYQHGNRQLYLDWLEKGTVPPETWAEFLKEGEAFNRRLEADPNVDRENANVQNLDLFKVFAKSPLTGVLAPLYEETRKRLFARVEHHQVHTDIDFEESREDAHEFFYSLRPGDHFLYNYDKFPEEYVMIEIDVRAPPPRNWLSIRAESVKDGRGKIFFWDDPRVVPVAVEHHKVHTDTDFEESREDTYEFFYNLKPGDHFMYNYEDPEEHPSVEYIMTKKESNLSIRAISVETGRQAILWYNDRNIGPVGPVEHWEVHTDVDFEESIRHTGRGGYRRALLRLAEEEEDGRLNEGYDPSLDPLEPIQETESEFAVNSRCAGVEGSTFKSSGLEENSEAERIDLSEIADNEYGYYRLGRLLEEAGFKGISVEKIPIDKNRSDSALRAYGETVYKETGQQFLVYFLLAPETLSIRPFFFDGVSKMEFISRSLIIKKVPRELPEKLIIPRLDTSLARGCRYDIEEALPEFRQLYERFLDTITSPVAHHEIHGDLGGYDELGGASFEEARRSKRPISTFDVTEFLTDYETAKAVEDRLKAGGYFNSPIARHGTIDVSKYWDFERKDKSVYGQDWYDQGFKEAQLHLEIEHAGNRMKRLQYSDKVLRVRVNVYGKSRETPDRPRPSWAGTYHWQEKKSVFDGKAIPDSWPGITLVPSSLPPEIRTRVDDLCAEAYAAFILGLLPRVEHHQIHTDVDFEEGLQRELDLLEGGYDESLTLTLSENLHQIDLSKISDEEFSEAIKEFVRENPEAAHSVAVPTFTGQELRFLWVSPGYNTAYPRGSAAGSFALKLEWNKRWGIATNDYTGGAFKVLLRTNRATLEDWFYDRHLPEDLKAHLLDWAARHPNTGGMSYQQTSHTKLVTRKTWAAVEAVWDKILASFKPVEHWEVHRDVDFEEAIERDKSLEEALAAGKNLTVGDLLPEDPAFEKYPWMRDVEVEINPNLDAMGQFIPGSEPGAPDALIILRDRTYIETLKHELRHLVQHTEKREHGGWSTGMWMGSRRKATLELARKIYKEMMVPRTLEDYTRAAGPWDSPAQAKKSYREYRAGFKTKESQEKAWLLAQQAAGERMYRDLPSEREARGEPYEEAVSAGAAATRENKYPPAGDIVDGREVGEDIPNTSSISSSLDNYRVLKKIREVPFSAFTQMGPLHFYSVSEETRTQRLAEIIAANNRIDPLIVAEDEEGPYIIEGGHRFDALRILGAKSFPALVVLDLDSLGESAYEEAVIEEDKNLVEAMAAFTGPEFDRERWIKVASELRHEFASELTVRLDGEEPGVSRTIMGLTNDNTAIGFNRGSSNGDQLVQITVNCDFISPSMSVHLYGDEMKTGADVPETIERLLHFHDAYYLGGPNEKKRSMGRPEMGDEALMLEALQKDPEYPALEKFYTEFVARLFNAVPEHHQVHGDYDFGESIEEAKAKISPVMDAFEKSLSKGPDPAVEAFMLKTCAEASPPGRVSPDVEYLYHYASEVMHKRWPEAEPLIVRWTSIAIFYAEEVIKGRWPELEKKLVADWPPEELKEKKEMRAEAHIDPVWYARRIMKVPEEKAIAGVYSPNFQEYGFDFNYVPHHQIHTDVDFEEARSLGEMRLPLKERISPEGLQREIEVIASLKESKEVTIDDRALDAAIAWARETFRHAIMMDHGPRRSITITLCYPEDLLTTMKVKPAASVKFQFAKLNNGEEYFASIIVRYIRPEAYSGGAMEIAIVDIVEGYPIPMTWEELEAEIREKYTKDDSKFLRFFRKLKFFDKIREAFEGFMQKLLAPVEHWQVHTDVDYGESRSPRLTEAVVKVSYATTTPESAEEGDYADTGWVNEQGHDCEPDEFDRDEGLDRVDLAAKFLEYEGAIEIEPDLYESSSNTDYSTGAQTTNNYHLEGFSDLELEDISLLMKGQERTPRPIEHHKIHTDVDYEESVDKTRTEGEPETFPVDPASVRIADYELLRKYGRIHGKPLPELPAGDPED